MKEHETKQKQGHEAPQESRSPKRNPCPNVRAIQSTPKTKQDGTRKPKAKEPSKNKATNGPRMRQKRGVGCEPGSGPRGHTEAARKAPERKKK